MYNFQYNTNPDDYANQAKCVPSDRLTELFSKAIKAGRNSQALYSDQQIEALKWDFYYQFAMGFSYGLVLTYSFFGLAQTFIFILCYFGLSYMIRTAKDDD